MLRRLPICPRRFRPRDMPSGPRRAGPGRTGERRADRQLESESGLTMGMSVPGMRSPCFAVDESTTAGRSRRSTWALHRSATAREAAPYPTTLLPSICCATSQSRSPWAWASASSCRRPTATGSRTPRQVSSDRSAITDPSTARRVPRIPDRPPGESCRRRARSATPSVD